MDPGASVRPWAAQPRGPGLARAPQEVFQGMPAARSPCDSAAWQGDTQLSPEHTASQYVENPSSSTWTERSPRTNLPSASAWLRRRPTRCQRGGTRGAMLGTACQDQEETGQGVATGCGDTAGTWRRCMEGAGAGTTRSCGTGPGPGLYQGNTAGGRAPHACLAQHPKALLPAVSHCRGSLREDQLLPNLFS